MTPPVLTLSGTTPATVVVGNSYIDDGATYTDNVDAPGFIAAYNSGTLDINSTGSYTISYVHADTAGNTGSIDRIVNVVDTPDTTPPVVTLSGAATVNVEYGSSLVDDGATWTDNVDGSGVISGYNSGSVNTGALGTYIVSYEYMDGAGNVGSATRTVIVADTIVPTAIVTYSTLSTTSGSVTATLTGASESITITNNTGSATHVFSSNGSFTFTFQDSSGNTGSTVANVANIDTTAPVITLLGVSPTTVNQ